MMARRIIQQCSRWWCKLRSQEAVIRTNANHFTCNCRAFLLKDVDKRGSIVEDASACKLFLHISFRSTLSIWWNKYDVQGSNQSHSRLLHCCQIQGICCFVGYCWFSLSTQHISQRQLKWWKYTHTCVKVTLVLQEAYTNIWRWGKHWCHHKNWQCKAHNPC